MPRQPSLGSRIGTALTWPVAVVLTSWDYMWRITVLHREDSSGSDAAEHLPPPMPDGVDREEMQEIDSGSGPLFHRLYSIDITESDDSGPEVFARLCADLQQAVPGRLARFHKVLGSDDDVATGDEYVVRMPGPWDGPVRVIDRQPCSFRLQTLSGHLEAGQIEFSVRAREAMLHFEIESWTRSGDAVANLLYHHLKLAKEVQAHMWISFLENVAELADGRGADGITIRTHQVS